MRRSEPSFYRLFRRGHYCNISAEQEEFGAKPDREERERFAVASLAFCLKHDGDFRKQFWERICRVADDPIEMPPIEPTDIFLEPPHWADLRLVSDKSGVRYVWVVEVKAGSHLEDEQDPSNIAKFTKPDVGYGDLFSKEENKRGAQMRYIVLGAEPRPKIPFQKILGIVVQTRGWDALLGLNAKGIVKDLVESLGELRIGPFFMEQAKQITVNSGIESVGKAQKVLEAFSEKLGIKPEFDTAPHEEGGGHMGVYFMQPSKRRAPSKMYTQLQKVTRKDGWCIAWFGYVYDSDGQVSKEAWFYFNDDARRKIFQTKLKKKFPNARQDRDGSELAVAVKSTPKESTCDFDWFDKVFQRAVA